MNTFYKVNPRSEKAVAELLTSSDIKGSAGNAHKRGGPAVARCIVVATSAQLPGRPDVPVNEVAIDRDDPGRSGPNLAPCAKHRRGSNIVTAERDRPGVWKGLQRCNIAA